MTNLPYVLVPSVDAGHSWAAKQAIEHRQREEERKRQQDLAIWLTYLDSEDY